ncbi:MAG: GNAT family N-acetyltransferase, partial [Bdellovibrionota bacterium]
ELAVSLKGGRHIGGVRLGIQSQANRIADIGYALRHDHWGSGYGTELARAILEFGFRNCGLHRIWATADPENRASWRVLEKCGMKREGLLRENLLVRGSWRDSILYSILEGEFRQTAAF